MRYGADPTTGSCTRNSGNELRARTADGPCYYAGDRARDLCRGRNSTVSPNARMNIVRGPRNNTVRTRGWFSSGAPSQGRCVSSGAACSSDAGKSTSGRRGACENSGMIRVDGVFVDEKGRAILRSSDHDDNNNSNNWAKHRIPPAVAGRRIGARVLAVREKRDLTGLKSNPDGTPYGFDDVPGRLVRRNPCRSRGIGLDRSTRTTPIFEPRTPFGRS